MFKKQCKVSNQHAVSNKDKKRIKEQLLKQHFSPESLSVLWDGEDELFIEKLVGCKAVVYARDDTPLLFAPEGSKAQA